MPAAFWLIGLVALIAGLIILKIGLWPRRRGDTPHCRKCGYNLTALTSERCPECGTEVSPKTTVQGERRRSTGKTILGTALLVIALTWLASPLAGINTWRFYPTFAVIPYLQSSNYTTAQAAWDEIERRMAAGKLSVSQRTTVFDRFTHFQLAVRPQIALGDPPIFAVRNTSANYAIPRDIIEVVQPLELWIDGEHQNVADFNSDEDVGHGESGWPIPFDCSPGKHNLKVTFTVERYLMSCGPLGQGISYNVQTLLDQRTMTMQGSFEILATRPADDIKLIGRPELTRAIQNLIDVDSLWINHTSQQTFIMFYIKGPLSDNVAFDPFVKVGDREYPVSSFTVARGHGQTGIEVHGEYDGPLIQFADVILRPSKTAARETPDFFEIWGGELVYKDVPVKVIDDKPATRPATSTAPS